MKQCPKCGTTYTDATLRFCLADGAVLVETDEQATVFQTPPYETGRPVRGGQMRVEIPQELSVDITPFPQPLPDPGPSWLKIFLVVGLLGALVLIGIAGAGALIYFNKNASPVQTDSQNKEIAKLSPSPSPNSETDKLREQIANLEKRLNEQKNTNQPSTSATPRSDQSTVTSTTARVNSPGDGFLALRSFPNSEEGERITQIPHGAIVKINGCLPRTRIGSKTGRWCRANYGSYNGWVFDAWLIY